MAPSISRFTHYSEWIALFLLTACFFVSSISVSLTTITYMGAVLFLLLSDDWRARCKRIIYNKAAISFLILVLLCLIGVLYSTSTKPLIIKALNGQLWLLVTPLLMSLITNERWRERMINAFLAAMLLTLFLAYLKTIFHFPFLEHLPHTQPNLHLCVFSNHIIQSFAMSIAAFICGYRCLFLKKYRLVYAILFVLMGINVFFMSDGRTGYGIFILLFCYLGVIRFGWKGILTALLLGVVILGGAYLGSQAFRTRMSMIYVHYQTYHQSQTKALTSIGQRLEMIGIAKQMIAHRPWIGYGTGGIRTELPRIVPAQDRVLNPSIDYVESIYLNYWLEYGVLGLFVFLGVVILQIRLTFQLPQNYRYLMQAVFIAILFGGIFNGFLNSFPFSHFYSLFAALCFSCLPVGNYDSKK